jgi:hypothetical protein
LSLNAALGVWSLVSGLPPGRREKRHMLMLQAFVDDSKSEGKPPFFVLGGYIATAEVWAQFSADWQGELERPRPLKYFKFNEAFRKYPSGQFWGWDREDSVARAARFRAVIEKHDLHAFHICVRVDHLEQVYGDLGKKWRNPYYLCTAALIPELGRMPKLMGQPGARVDVIFDEQVMEKSTVMRAWEEVQDDGSFTPDPPELLTHVLKNPPIWRDDEDVLPLQAADMHATWMGMTFEAVRDGRPDAPMPGKAKNLRVTHLALTVEELQRRRAYVAERQKGLSV